MIIEFVVIIGSLFFHYSLSGVQRAYCIVPVADVVSIPFNGANVQEIEKAYATLPCSALEELGGCTRIHQLLFNECVEIIPQRKAPGQVYVRILNCFYFNWLGQKEYWQGWVQSNCLKLADEINEQALSAIPNPIHFPHAFFDPRTIILLEPWHHGESNQIFSAGTRFVMVSDDDPYTYTIVYYDSVTGLTGTSRLPKHLAVRLTEQTLLERRDLFIKILHKWAMQSHGVIPYVWGGSSFTKVSTDKNFFETPSGWNRPKYTTLYTGIDCSELILRAAQCAGLPYFLKNSATIAQGLVRLTNHDTVQNGDILWHKGHVMVVADAQNGYLIEARGYNSGAGKVQRMHLTQRFAEVHSWQDILQASHLGKPLHNLTADGQLGNLIDNYAIFRINSLYRITGYSE